MKIKKVSIEVEQREVVIVRANSDVRISGICASCLAERELAALEKVTLIPRPPDGDLGTPIGPTAKR
ncbi:MAG: hypothetical protein LC113_11640 [Acidobacteria bacterium]|nr:hypothetical protein [Acidobacteriota bacterium]